MVQINFAQKQVNAKIVFYGPGMSGKTTNLEIIHQRAPAPNKGDLTSISTDGDRTLFFDFMPLDLGTVSGMRTCFQIYTVPGQVYYNSTRKLVLQGVDGVVFVADSSAAMVEANLESLRNLEQNLTEYGKSLSSMPIVIQYNKRDLPDAMSVEELNNLLNPMGFPWFEAVAAKGQGVFPTLKGLAAKVLESIHGGGRNAAPAAAPAPQPSGLGPMPTLAPPPPLTQTGFRPRPVTAAAPASAEAAMAVGAHPAAGLPPMPAPLSPMEAGLPPAPQALPTMPQAMPAMPAAPPRPQAAPLVLQKPEAARPAPRPQAAARPVAPAPRPAPPAAVAAAPAFAAPPAAPVPAQASAKAAARPARAGARPPAVAAQKNKLVLAVGFVAATLVVGAVLAKFVFPLL
jgi:hypothetical protein